MLNLGHNFILSKFLYNTNFWKKDVRYKDLSQILLD